jgi:hypothetical protein
VWVNTETHVYHREGSRFYGTTKKGKYVSEADAIKEGDRARSQGTVTAIAFARRVCACRSRCLPDRKWEPQRHVSG